MTREVIDGVLHETVSVPLDSPKDVVTVNVAPADPEAEEVPVAEPIVTSDPEVIAGESPKEDGGPSVEEVAPEVPAEEVVIAQ